MVMRCRKSHKGTPPPCGALRTETQSLRLHTLQVTFVIRPHSVTTDGRDAGGQGRTSSTPPPLSPAHQLTSIFDGLFATVLINYHLYFRWTL